jgi:predicted nuclease of predicted toxin-antitoxin system
VRLLVDENLSGRVADRLQQAGYDAVHVTAVDLSNTDDEVILQSAAVDDRIIVTSDADFGTLLALSGRRRPSVLMLRSSDHLTPDQQADLVIATIERIDEDLVAGAVASVTPRRIRVRPLPMSSP